jgi:hypothetical protein
MKYSSVKGFIIVLSEFANFKFSGTSLYLVNLCGTTSLLTAKIQFQIVHLLYVR